MTVYWCLPSTPFMGPLSIEFRPFIDLISGAMFRIEFLASPTGGGFPVPHNLFPWSLQTIQLVCTSCITLSTCTTIGWNMWSLWWDLGHWCFVPNGPWLGFDLGNQLSLLLYGFQRIRCIYKSTVFNYIGSCILVSQPQTCWKKYDWVGWVGAQLHLPEIKRNPICNLIYPTQIFY